MACECGGNGNENLMITAMEIFSHQHGYVDYEHTLQWKTSILPETDNFLCILLHLQM
jgi:hypothetical protein